MSNLTDLQPPYGEVSYQTQYGTHTFNASTNTTKFQVRPVLDAAKRTVICNEISITLEEYLEPSDDVNVAEGLDVDAGVDVVVQTAVQILSTPAGLLTWIGRGFGPYRINLTPDGNRDLVWGPIPELISVEAIANNSAKITWNVRFATTQYLNAVSKGQVMEYVFSMSYSLDAERMTTRKCSGFITIPATRVSPGSLKITDNADRYRELLAMEVPIGFCRTEESYTLDEAKTKLTFSVTDKQMPPNVWPPGVTSAKASHSISNTAGKLSYWTAILEAEFTMARGALVKSAILSFFAILKQRMALTVGILQSEGLPGLPVGPRPIATRPLAFSMSEPEIYGPGETKVRLSCQYAIIGCGLGPILGKTGLWLPVGNNWSDWMTSVQVPYGVRGSANLVFRLTDDAIQDLNTPGIVPVTPSGG